MEELKECKFVDRDDAISYVMGEVQELCARYTYRQIICIYGIGGIGKSRFIDRLSNNELLDYSKAVKVQSVTFELTQRGLMVNNLIKIRKSCDYPCPIFDFSLLSIWDYFMIDKLDDDVLSILKDSYHQEIGDASHSILSTLGNVPIPPATALVHAINAAIRSFAAAKHYEEIELIKSMSNEAILRKLPDMLGRDINDHLKHRMERNPKERLLFFFDAYVQDGTDPSGGNWLLKLIEPIESGLFVITSREKVIWEDRGIDIQPYELSDIPDKKVMELLKCEFCPADHELIQKVYEMAQGVPLYVSLALELYHKCGRDAFGDRDLGIKSFRKEQLAERLISHMDDNIQKAVLALACVRVFDQNIFAHLVNKLNLPCSNLDYYDIIETTLCNYVTEEESLVKLHDVFTRDASQSMKPRARLDVIEEYVAFIAQRNSQYSLADLLTLFQNILLIELELDNDISTACLEYTVDVFLQLQDRGALLVRDNILFTAQHERTRSMMLLIEAIETKEVDTSKALAIFEQIENPLILGRHYSTFSVVKGYRSTLQTGMYDDFINQLDEVIRTEQQNKRAHSWASIKAQIYLADCKILKGCFLEALELLEKLKQEVEDISRDYNYFLIVRSMGHIYRFNMMPDMAMRYYRMASTSCNSSTKVQAYCAVNYCESLCFCSPEDNEEEFLYTESNTASKNSPRNLGKFLYSKAIRHAQLQNYQLAYETCRESKTVNHNDGYLSGELFADIAQAYIEYAEYGSIPTDTKELIVQKIKMLKVYGFLLLPISIADGDDLSLFQKQYEWVDFNYTVRFCREFLRRLHPEYPGD